MNVKLTYEFCEILIISSSVFVESLKYHNKTLILKYQGKFAQDVNISLIYD